MLAPRPVQLLARTGSRAGCNFVWQFRSEGWPSPHADGRSNHGAHSACSPLAAIFVVKELDAELSSRLMLQPEEHKNGLRTFISTELL